MHGKGNLEASTWFDKPGTNRTTRSGDEPNNVKKKYGKLEVRNKFYAPATYITHFTKQPSFSNR
jgi:hypothetical protein